MNAFASLSQAVVPDHAFCMRLTIALVHLVWQGLAIAALSLAAARLLRRRSANLRYAVHVAALALLALCLPVTYFSVDAQPFADRDAGLPPASGPLPADRGGISPAIIPPGREQQLAGDGFSTPEPGVRPLEKSATRAEMPARSDMATVATAPPTRFWLQHFIEPVAPYATALYFFGVLSLSLRLMLGLWGGQRLRRSAMPVSDPGLLRVVRRQARQIGLRFMPVVAWCQRVSTPIVVGIVTPAILLPASLAGGLTPDQLSALLTHELAHIRRFDLVVNLLQRVIETLLFFHPAVWYLSRQISRERENCCDDCVLAAGWHGADYAEALLRMAELCFQRRPGAVPVAGLGAAGARPSEFKRRVLRLLGVEVRTRLRLSRLGVIALAIVLMASLAGPALTYSRGVRGPDEISRKIDHVSPPHIATDGASDNSPEIAAAEPPKKADRAATPGLRIHGQVLDAATGKPVEECRVIPASVFDKDSLQYTWQPQYRKKFDGGAYEWKTDRPWEMTRLRIEAPGYRPAVSRVITSAEGEVELDVKLSPDEGIAGVVLTPDGQPAADAQLALATWTFEVQVRDGELRQQGHARDLGLKVVYADEAGRFRLPPEVDPAVIVVAHETGYAEVDVPRSEAAETKGEKADNAAEAHDLEIKLMRWGRVEGRVLASEKSVEGAKFWVGSGYTKRSDLAQIHASDGAATGADGRFVVERVPPGRGWCQRYVPNRENNGSHSISGLNVAFDIPPGETVKLELGGGGRTVVGRIQLPEAFLKKLDWSKVSLRIFPRAPHIGFPGDNEMWQSYGAFLKTEEGQAYNRETVEIAADGSFRIEALPPADYQVVIHVPGAALAEEPRPDGSVAQGGGNFKIAPIRREGDDKALDVGAFRLFLAPEQPTKKENAAAKPERPAGDGQAPESPRADGSKVNAAPMQVALKLDRAEFLLGESIAVEYEMTNVGKEPARYESGAVYPALRINDGYRLSAVKIDENGKPFGKPVPNWPAPENYGGPVGNATLKPREVRRTTLFVTRVVRFTEPGRYRLRIENIDRHDQTLYSVGETVLTLKTPTPEQARTVYETMKRAPQEAYNDGEMQFLGGAADFETMHQPVYLPLLREFAMKGEVDALPSLERMESLKANEVLVAALLRALDGDDVEVARACFRHLQPSLPFPNWYDEGNRDYDQPRRERSARTWKPEFVLALTRLARRLIPEVAFQIRTLGENPLQLQKNGQPLLGEIDYIYRCLGRPEDLADCMKAYALSIELTKTLPLETHQYFRPRGSAFGFGHTVFRMMQRGAQAPTKPVHPGEAATFAIALRTQKEFRPAGWEAEVMKWLKAGPPYLAEVILDHLPDPIPEEVLDWLPAALASDSIDLAIAACKIAGKHPRPAYKKPLQNLLETAKEQYLVKFSRAAAKANGLEVASGTDE